MQHLDKSKIGAIGENMVIAQLLEHGWDAINANLSIRNFKSIDVICINEKQETKLIQVKTTIERSSPVGFSIGKATRANLEKQIIGPWVFVFASEKNQKLSFKYYILSRQEVIDFISTTNEWYNNWPRKKALNPKGLCAVDIRWFINKPFKYRNYQLLPQILKDDPEDNWEKIWE